MVALETVGISKLIFKRFFPLFFFIWKPLIADTSLHLGATTIRAVSDFACNEPQANRELQSLALLPFRQRDTVAQVFSFTISYSVAVL